MAHKADLAQLSQLRQELAECETKMEENLQARKRKISALYLVSALANAKITRDAVEGLQGNVAKLLDQADLPSGQPFNLSLVPEPSFVANKRVKFHVPEESRHLEEHSEEENDKMDQDSEGAAKEAAVAVDAVPDGDRSAAVVPAEHGADDARQTLAAAETAKKSSSASDFMIFVLPERLPEPPQSRKPLSELYYTTQSVPIYKLIPQSHKTLSTDVYQVALLEGKLAVVQARIEELKRSNKWSLRQHQKFKAGLRPKSHWDNLMDEAKWMATDFKEERKLKIAICNEIATAVEAFWAGEDVCIARKPIAFLDGTTEELDNPESQETGVIKASALSPLEKSESLVHYNFGEHKSMEGSDKGPLRTYLPFDSLNEVSQKVYDFLPVMETFKVSHPYLSEYENLSLTSITKFLSAPDASKSWQKIVVEEASRCCSNDLADKSKSLLKVHDKTKSVLFLNHHDSHRKIGVRAPHPPPTKGIKFRTPTLWLPPEDTKLIKLAKEFNYNWNIVSMHMLVKSTQLGMVSNMERRTPWQCFERWCQLNPNFSLSELKGQYAQQAQEWMEAATKSQTSTKRRVAPIGVTYDNLQRGCRRLRWASMFDAIRKSMRKRESQQKPNASVANRKPTADTPTKGNIPTPAELSKLKYERDKAVAEQFFAQQKQQQMALAASTGSMGSGSSRSAQGPKLSQTATGSQTVSRQLQATGRAAQGASEEQAQSSAQARAGQAKPKAAMQLQASGQVPSQGSSLMKSGIAGQPISRQGSHPPVNSHPGTPTSQQSPLPSSASPIPQPSQLTSAPKQGMRPQNLPQNVQLLERQRQQLLRQQASAAAALQQQIVGSSSPQSPLMPSTPPAASPSTPSLPQMTPPQQNSSASGISLNNMSGGGVVPTPAAILNQHQQQMMMQQRQQQQPQQSQQLRSGENQFQINNFQQNSQSNNIPAPQQGMQNGFGTMSPQNQVMRLINNITQHNPNFNQIQVIHAAREQVQRYYYAVQQKHRQFQMNLQGNPHNFTQQQIQKHNVNVEAQARTLEQMNAILRNYVKQNIGDQQSEQSQ